MKRKSLLALIIFLLIKNFVVAQDEDTVKQSPFNVSLDLVSRYVWRGMDIGDSPSIQPGFSYNYKNFSIGTWGAFALNFAGAQEVDLFASYTIKNVVTIAVTDYFFPSETITYQYFDYNQTTTGHIFELSASFNGTKKIPLTFLLGTNVYGADAVRLDSDSTVTGIQYSTYAEFGYSYSIVNAFIGFNLTTPDKSMNETGFYGDSFGVINIGLKVTKEVRISKSYSVPIYVSLISNPQRQKIYLVAGISF